MPGKEKLSVSDSALSLSTVWASLPGNDQIHVGWNFLYFETESVKITGFIRCPIVKFNIKDGCIWRYRVIPEATIILCDWPGPVQTGCSCSSLSAAKYHLREKSIAYPTEKLTMRMHCKARREGYALFDEDDVCAVYWTCTAMRCESSYGRGTLRATLRREFMD